jgi:hypothetical protein
VSVEAAAASFALWALQFAGGGPEDPGEDAAFATSKWGGRIVRFLTDSTALTRSAFEQLGKVGKVGDRSLWTLSSRDRGLAFEAHLGYDGLPDGFDTFDHYDPAARTAISVNRSTPQFLAIPTPPLGFTVR